jgi:putative ABC transport system substrate-binding protein
MMRREFIAALLGAAASWPLAARAQQPNVPLVGYIYPGSADTSQNRIAAFQRGLSESGFVEGRNVAIEYRWGEDQYDRLADLADDLVRRQAAVIVASAIPAALAARRSTTTIPIVFSTSLDPVQIGLVQSLNRPGGNITGVTDMAGDVAAKQLGLLHELLPTAERFALLVDPGAKESTEQWIAEANSAASTIGKPIEVLRAHNSSEIDAAFATAVQTQRRADAVLVANQVLFITRLVQLVTLAARYRLPTLDSRREFAEAGGLMSYGSSAFDRERQLGIYTARILKGEKPAELPILRASKFEFVINLQTAKAIGLEVPPTLIARADKVVE